MHDAITVPCSILYIELRINFRTRDLTAMRKQQTQAGEAKKKENCTGTLQSTRAADIP